RFSAAEFTLEIQPHARFDASGQARSESHRRLRVLQMHAPLRSCARVAMIWKMSHAKATRRARHLRPAEFAALAAKIKSWGRGLGFQAVGIADTDLSEAEPRLRAWLASGFAGELDYMRKHGVKRTRPASLVPGTLRVISARMDYRPDAADSGGVLADGGKAFVARYALGRDYHKVLRGRLQRLAERIAEEIG